MEIKDFSLNPEPFRINVTSAILHLPKALHQLAQNVQVKRASLTSSGFSGIVEWIPGGAQALVPLPGDLADRLKMSVTKGSLTFEKSALIAGLLEVNFSDLVVPLPGLQGTEMLIRAGRGVKVSLTSSTEGVAFTIEGFTTQLRI